MLWQAAQTPIPPPSGLRHSFLQLLGVLISDMNQLYHPPKPGSLLTQGHPPLPEHSLGLEAGQCSCRKARPLASILDHPKEPSPYSSFP